MFVVVTTLLLAEAFVTKEHKTLTAGCNQTRKVPASLLQRASDPHCREGIMSADMQACCQKDCGECSDASDVCGAKATNGRGTTCCPVEMLAGNLPSCENSKAPCAVPPYVRSAPDVTELTSGEGDRTAIDDCGSAVPDEDKRHKLATHFLHFAGQDVSRESATETECGSFGAMSAISASCDGRDDCMGFTANGDAPDCMLIAGDAVEHLESAGHDVYLKVEGLGGRRFLFDPMPYSGECSKSCGGGELTREIKCKSCKSADATDKKCEGLSAPLGMCSGNVAMNAHSLLSTTKACNTFACESVCGDKNMFIFHFTSAGYYPDEITFNIDQGTLAPPEGEALTGEEGMCTGDTDGAACCLADNVHDLNAHCMDSYGDDWNGANLYVKAEGDEGEGTPLCQDIWGDGDRTEIDDSVTV